MDQAGALQGVINTHDQFHDLYDWLDQRGMREAALVKELDQRWPAMLQDCAEREEKMPPPDHMLKRVWYER